MKRALSSIGIGSATVDTVFPTTTVTAGESVDAEVRIDGGSAEQQIDAIYFALATRYRMDEGSSNAVVDEFRLADGFTVAPGEEKTVPVTIDIPVETPVTMGDAEVWVDTGLDIDWALDPDDTDALRVDPDPHLDAVLSGVERLGFEFRTGMTISAADTPLAPSQSFVQEFEYDPVAATYTDRLDELELACAPTGDGVDVLVEVDPQGDAVTGWDTADEQFARRTFETTDPDAVADELEALVGELA